MTTLPKRVLAYISLVIAAGAISWLVAPGSIHWVPLIAFVLAYAVVEAFPVLKSDQEFISISGTVACLAVLAIEPKSGIAAAVVGSILAGRFLKIQWVKSLYNAAQCAVQLFVAWQLYVMIGGDQSQDTLRVLGPFLIMYAGFWFANVLLISGLFSLLQRKSFLTFVRQEFRGFYLQQGLMMVINCTVLASYHAFGLWALLLLVVVLLLVRYAMAAYDHARSFYIRIIQLLTGVMEAQDRFTHGHSERVAHYALAVGQTLRLPEAQLDLLRTAALLHDVGKMKIPREILHKVTPLTDDEFDQIKEHPVIGAEWVGKLDPRGQLAKTIRHHHERWDGKGYPDGLAGHEIPELSRIIAVVDAFDAMTSDRPYRSSMSTEKALSILRSNAGTQFDPRVVNAFLACAEDAVRDVPQPSLGLGQSQDELQAEQAAAAAKQDSSEPTSVKKRRATKKAESSDQAAGRV